MNRRLIMFGSIGLGFVLGFVFPRYYLALWGAGFLVAFVLAWPELKAGYSRRADRTMKLGKKKDEEG